MTARRSASVSARTPGSDSHNHEAFGAELRRLRVARDITLAQLASRIRWDKSFIARVERGDRSPKLQFVKDCDIALAANGALVAIWTAERGALTPAQLPAPPRHFVGRSTELATLDAMVAAARSDHHADTPLGQPSAAAAPLVIAIDGPPGSGKTGLALHWAHRVKSAWPDGQLYVDLRGFAPAGYPLVNPAEILDAFCRALGADPRTLPQTERDLAAHYRSLAAGRRLLVVLDNALDANQVVPLLPGTASCTVVITSRSVLSDLAIQADAHHLHLQDLSEDDARRLLAAAVGDGPVAAEPDAVADLIKLAGRTPLALRIAAERTTADHGHAISELVADLRAAADRLDGLEGPVGDSIIRAVFDSSYRKLPDQTARLFRLLGLFGGPTMSINAAAALSGLDYKAARTAIRTLQHANLVEPAGRDRIAQHALIRTYAYELAHRHNTSDERALGLRNLTEWYVYAAHRASQALGPANYPLAAAPDRPANAPRLNFDAATALEWFDAELPNLVPVARLMINAGPGGAVWQFCAGLFGYLHRRKPWSTWRQTHELAMIISEHQSDWHGYALVATSLAEAQRLAGHIAEAQYLYDRAVAVSTAHADPHNTARALAGSAYLAIDCGLFDAARDYARHALIIARDIGATTGESIARIALARALSHRRRYDDARRLLTNAIHALRRDNDIHRTALAVANLGELAANTGCLREAADRFADAAAYAADASDYWSEARHRLRRGDMLYDLEDYAGAEDQWLRSIDYFREVDDVRGYREAAARLDRLPGAGRRS